MLVVRRLGFSISETRAALDSGCEFPALANARVQMLDDQIRRLRVQRALVRHAGRSGAVAPERYARVLAKVGA